MPFSFASPEDLVLLEASLERAWATIVERHGFDPLKAPGERERLAYIVAALWQQGQSGCVAERAVEQFEATAPTLPPTPTKPDSGQSSIR